MPQALARGAHPAGPDLSDDRCVFFAIARFVVASDKLSADGCVAEQGGDDTGGRTKIAREQCGRPAKRVRGPARNAGPLGILSQPPALVDQQSAAVRHKYPILRW